MRLVRPVLVLVATIAFVVQAQAVAQSPTMTISGVASNHSSARIFWPPVQGAKDYRVYDVANPNEVKYAGQAYMIAGPSCPGYACNAHFVSANGQAADYPYRITSGPNGGPQVIMGAATDIEWNNLGDGQAHTLVVEAVDALGPVPLQSLYSGNDNTPLAAGGMLGANKGQTADGKISANGQGPYTNNPKMIASSQPFVVQPDTDYAAIKNGFYDTFDNGEPFVKLAQNANAATYKLNAGTDREWLIEYKDANTRDSMPFISADHFMDMLFDGGTPGNNEPTHTKWSTMSMSPAPTFDMSGGKILHMTIEVDAHQSFRRWLGFNLAPASDRLTGWNPFGVPLNRTNTALFVEQANGTCTLKIFRGSLNPQQPWNCGWEQMYNPNDFDINGLGRLDHRSKLDLFVSKTHAALFEDDKMIVQADYAAVDFVEQPVVAYFTHYLYHSDADVGELKGADINSAPICYPLNSYWFNAPLTGSNTSCANYPAGYGFPYSDERHWDNMGVEVLASDAAPANDFSPLLSTVQRTKPVPIGEQPPAIPAATSAPAASTATTQPAATQTPTSVPSATPTRTATPAALPAGQWIDVTPANMVVRSDLPCGNFGAGYIVSDPNKPSDVYVRADCQGIWKSTDAGATWTGPINTGTNGNYLNTAGGSLAIAPGPVLYLATIRGSYVGFARSMDGGVSWTGYHVPGAPQERQDMGQIAVDPYDGNHLLMSGHEMTVLFESMDGGQTWTRENLDSSMGAAGTSGVFFIDTGTPATTRNTWLWEFQQDTGAGAGTWRTSNGGASWTKVNTITKPHGSAAIYQPDKSGVLYEAGFYGPSGPNGEWQGIWRSTDFGQTWSGAQHVGNSGANSIIWGTLNGVYASFDWACQFCDVNPNLQSAPNPGITGWKDMVRPANMKQGPNQVAVANDGSSYVFVGASMNAGVWRYVENVGSQPPPTATPTASPTSTPTVVPTASSTATALPSSTPTPTAQPTSVPTSTATSVPTQTETPIPTATATATATPVPTSTAVPATCQIEVILNGEAKLVTRPVEFCTDQ